MKAVTIRFEDELHMKLKLACVKNGVSIQETIIKLVEESLKENKK